MPLDISASQTLSQNPVFLHPYGLPNYQTVGQALSDYTGDDHIHVLYPRKIESAAREFVNFFPGQVLYAVKANPHPLVLKVLWDQGVRQFDVASRREIDLVHSLLPEAQLFLMHPVKSRALIAHAYSLGVRDFAFDCDAELEKILACTSGAPDLHLHLRLSLPKGRARMPLSGKFGADFHTATYLLKKSRTFAQSLGVCFHVGSQCLAVDDYAKAISYVRCVIDESAVSIDSLDLGGGFPVAYPDMPTIPMVDYFTSISASLCKHDFSHLTILGEPGRALCASGGSTLARIELRKGTDLYLNDGTYGTLFDAGQFAWKFPVHLHKHRSKYEVGPMQDFRFFGPTCDSVDVMEGPFRLPCDACEGDWVEIMHLGAYGQALSSRFNGFHSDTTITVLEASPVPELSGIIS